ncbi:MAG TPA: FG-GAP-like repeat-containing protein [Labilithrix sp.]|nr:FG-GAP-like repeat-containing protein [Labilithrix sp.]
MSLLRHLPVRPALLLLGAPLCMTIGCAVDPSEPDAPVATETSAALRNCPPSDPDYPTCAPEPDGCTTATGTLTVSPSPINAGQSSTLHWTVNKPATCRRSATLDGLSVAASGSKTVTPMSDTSFGLRMGTKLLASTSVKVILPPTVRINGNTADWKRLLVQAVGEPGKRVVLATDLDMDLTGYANIYVREGVTITSEAPPLVFQQSTFLNVGGLGGIGGIGAITPPPARNPQVLGPRLFTNDRPRPLFNVECNSDHTIWGDNAKFIGFRIQGPHQDTEDGDDNLERGIQITSCNGVEIGDMEISGFSGQGIYIQDPNVWQFGPQAVSVHDSYIHNNQHVGGNGYGVETGPGAYAKIERNVFDFNRHAIASSGAAGTGYQADHNLVLKGGGYHDKWYNEYTHLFDVHGDANCPDIPGNQHTWNCGNAGDQYWITNNAFQFTNDLSVKLRGVPRVQAVITGNVFAQGSLDDAVETKSSQNIIMHSNRANIDPFGHYGVCDFDGDGRDDLFLATGVSWWYASAGKMNWTYLSPNTELLDQVGLGDFDGDRRCDVFAVNTGTGAFQISSGGRGSWTDLPGGNQGVPIDQLRFGDFNGDRIMDVFRRAPDGQWYASSPGRYPWTALQSSSAALADLRFGDFDGDGVTDVFHKSGSTWNVSWRGTSTWQPLNTSVNDPPQILIGNVDGLPGDDILKYVVVDANTARWEISSGGRGTWQTFATIVVPGAFTQFPAARTRSILGNFDGLGSADLLAVDLTRKSSIFSQGKPAFAPYSLYPY